MFNKERCMILSYAEFFMISKDQCRLNMDFIKNGVNYAAFLVKTFSLTYIFPFLLYLNGYYSFNILCTVIRCMYHSLKSTLVITDLHVYETP